MNQSDYKQTLSSKNGNAWVGILILLVLMTGLGIALVTDTIKTLSQSKRAEQVVIAQALVDGGVDKAIWKLNTTPGYIGENGINLGTGTVDISITNIDANNKQVVATAYVPSKTNPKVTRKVRANLSATPDEQGIAFRYGIQVGVGGVDFQPNTQINGNVYSNGNITGKGTITGSASAVGTIDNGISASTKKTNQPNIPMPAVDQNYWKSEANRNNDEYNGDLTVSSGNFGPRRVNGNLSLSNVTIKGPIYVTGTLSLGGTITLDNAFGSNGTAILVDGTINNNGATIKPTTANPKGYILFISNSNINLGNDSNGGIYYSLNGTLTINPHSHLVSLAAKTVSMQPNSDLTYDAGLASADFADGPGGSWVLKEWQIIH